MPEIDINEQPVAKAKVKSISDRYCKKDWISTYLEYTDNHEATRKVHKWAAISVIAGALERKVWVNRGSYHLFPNLYVFIVGSSGVIRKSTSTAMAVQFLRNLEGMRLMSERVTAASLIQQLHGSGNAFLVDGKEQQQSSTYAYSSELVVLLKENFGSIQELLTTFYDCQPQDWRKPWIYETKSDGQIKIHGPCLNILGATTADWLVECIPAEQMRGGFASRVVFVVENEIPKPVAWPVPPANAEELERHLQFDLETIHALAGEMKLTQEARDYFTELYNTKLYPESQNNIDARFNGYRARKHDTILKLSQVFSASESNELLIRKDHIERSLMEIEELEGLMVNAFAVGGDNELAPHMRTVKQLVKKAGSTTLVELLAMMWQDTTEQQLRDVLENLKRLGHVQLYPDGMELGVVHVQGSPEL
jgi:hypothetical protein